jgi:hypothetical protein
VLTGHVHQAPFFPDGSWYDRIGGTLVFNAGRQPGAMPAHIIIDTDENRASWWSFEGQDEIDLDLERPKAAGVCARVAVSLNWLL